jgi:trehalose 6-phosphate synthase/phosphatase
LYREIARQRCVPVSLSEKQVDLFYNGFCCKTLWPLCHYFTESVAYQQETWEAYQQVNGQFADAVCSVYRPGDEIWVQDFQLMLLPAMLRTRLPEAVIVYFHHIPFPSSTVFEVLPWHRELLAGLLGANVIGFHTFDYALHFERACSRFLSVEWQDHTTCRTGHQSRVGVFPIGIDATVFSRAVKRPGVQKELLRLDDRFGQVKLMFSVDRLDFTKGLLPRLAAFERFLEDNPAWCQRVVWLMVVVPSRIEVDLYKRLKSQVDETVARINGRFSTLEWQPISYLSQTVPFDQLVALYHRADVALITPIRDGMNLVAKEFVASKGHKSGVLILSQMAGAKYELHQALLVNPVDLQEVAHAIRIALEMPLAEQRRRLRLMVVRVRRQSVKRWVAQIRDALADTQPSRVRAGDEGLQQNWKRRFQVAASRTLMLDYDGTLVPFNTDSVRCAPDLSLRRLLAKLAGMPHTQVVIVSGRDHQTLETWIRDPRIDLVAEHGRWLRQGGRVIETAPDLNWRAWLKPLLEGLCDRVPGTLIESKRYGLVWHYRPADSRHARDAWSCFYARHEGDFKAAKIDIILGNHIVEFQPHGMSKGQAIQRWLKDRPQFAMVIGDDVTDETMFVTARQQAITLKVGDGTTQAAFRLPDHTAVLNLLRFLIR